MGATDIESPYLDYRGAATYCNVHRVTLWRAVRDGHLRAAGPGLAVRFEKNELDRWMRSRGK